jgi:hypothetical protein
MKKTYLKTLVLINGPVDRLTYQETIATVGVAALNVVVLETLWHIEYMPTHETWNAIEEFVK